MKNVVKLILISALALVVVSCGNVNDSSDTEKETSSVSSISETDSSNESSETDSSEDESSKAVTTTKTTTKETAKTTTSAKQTSTTTSAVATQPVATKATAQPIVTTKATPKPTVTSRQTVRTTKATTKATQQTNSSFTIPSNATTLQKALYEIYMEHNVAANAKIAQQEFIKYGKQKMPKYKTSAYLHPYVDKNGKYTDFQSSGGNLNEYADGVEFYRVHILQSQDNITPQKAWEAALFEESYIKRDIDNHAYNLKSSSYPDEILWYVTVGVRGNDVDIVVLNGSTFDWKY